MKAPQVGHESGSTNGRPPTPEEIDEVIGCIPLLSAFFQKARSDMPARLQNSFAQHRLGPRHGAVLIQLFAARPLSVGQLAERLGSSLPTASELVGDLERGGLVRREVDSTNRRRTLVSLAEERREQFGEFLALRAAPLLRALDKLTPEQRDGFVTGLRLWVGETERRDDVANSRSGLRR